MIFFVTIRVEIPLRYFAPKAFMSMPVTIPAHRPLQRKGYLGWCDVHCGTVRSIGQLLFDLQGFRKREGGATSFLGALDLQPYRRTPISSRIDTYCTSTTCLSTFPSPSWLARTVRTSG